MPLRPPFTQSDHGEPFHPEPRRRTNHEPPVEGSPRAPLPVIPRSARNLKSIAASPFAPRFPTANSPQRQSPPRFKPRKIARPAPTPTAIPTPNETPASTRLSREGGNPGCTCPTNHALSSELHHFIMKISRSEPGPRSHSRPARPAATRNRRDCCGRSSRSAPQRLDYPRFTPSGPSSKSGSVKENVAPSLNTLSALISPPWASTSRLAMVSPNPAPPVVRAREGSTR